jgi:hypothetical protein
MTRKIRQKEEWRPKKKKIRSGEKYRGCEGKRGKKKDLTVTCIMQAIQYCR